jgi:membrane fusion protein (multidrug efflux system)
MTKMQTEVLDAATAALDESAKVRRKRLLLALGAGVLTLGTGFYLYEHFYASKFVSTDNAYTAAETAQVTPAIGGIVRDVRVTDTQHVKRGEIVATLDDTDASLALQQAEAELGRAERRVRGYVANDRSLGAQLESRISEERRAAAQLAAANADFERARIDLKRREALISSGAVSGDELTRTRNAYASAEANVKAAIAAQAQAHANFAAAIGSREANAVLIANTTEETNPEVTLARARREQARVNLDRTVIRAPVDGVVARRSVQVGQQIQAGMQMLVIVPIGSVHVDANFKEVQLEHVKIGQPVEITSDLYGHSVTYHGVVDGLAGGTSAAGLMNFIRTLSGAVATSIVTTSWEDKTAYMHAELAGLVDRTGETARTLANMGFSSDAARSALDNMAQSQGVMLATNELLLYVAVAFSIAAAVIWLAPRPTRKVDMTQAGH